ncbi:MAG: NAD(P)H-dependent oxidoreductase [Opitutaceae bacterium]|nr:NAD(P)H-dependent oxidoreductase [Opitutaceae bacterium]
MPKILAFSGSARKASYNTQLVRIAATGAQSAGADVTFINLADYPMPLFNEDLEEAQGIPPEALAFKHLLMANDGFLIASPEYNSAFTPLLKNAIDWASRSESEEEPPLVAFQGKVAGIMAASPGALGGIRGLVFLRMLLGNIGVTVLPTQKTIREAYKAFNDDGTLSSERDQQAVLELGRELTGTVQKLKS